MPARWAGCEGTCHVVPLIYDPFISACSSKSTHRDAWPQGSPPGTVSYINMSASAILIPNPKKILSSVILMSLLSPFHTYRPVCLILLTLLACEVLDYKIFSVEGV
jgi:hypothetical protein